jgi:hypothetical protein
MEILRHKISMISQPMAGKTNKEIIEAREKAAAELLKLGYKVKDSFFAEEKENEESLKEIGVIDTPVWFMAKAIEAMSFCDTVYFCKGWEEARGCRIEHEIAEKYGLLTIHEEEEK